MNLAIVDIWRGARFPIITDPNDDVFQVMKDLQRHVSPTSIEGHQVYYETDAEGLQMVKAQAEARHVSLEPWAGYPDVPVFENIPIRVTG
jgi:hypothetical protein